MIDRLKKGNGAFLAAEANDGDASRETIETLFENGRSPYACIVSCAESGAVEFLWPFLDQRKGRLPMWRRRSCG